MQFDDWLTEPEAAKRLGMSTRTLRRKVEDGTAPERRKRMRPGKPPEAVYNPRDVELMAAPSLELTRAVRFGSMREASDMRLVPGVIPEIVSDPVAEAKVQFDIVTALFRLSTSEQRIRVLDAALHLVQAERCVGGVLDGFLKGTRR